MQTQIENQPRTHDEVFYCPITGKLMVDPFIAEDGQTYDYAAIKEWIETHGKSPFTKQNLSVDNLQPNRPIMDLLEGRVGLPESIEPRIPDQSQIADAQIEAKKDLESDFLTFTTSTDVDGLMKVSIKAKDVDECPPIDIIAVVDRSGSMNQECAASENGVSLENGFSTLDIVKHSIKTVVKTLRPQDRLSIVIFDSKADVLFTLENMNEDGQAMASALIEGVQPGGTTDIYGALCEALSIVEMRDDKSRNPAIMLFTDGVPNVNPPEGEVKALQNILKTKNLACPIHTFGFGYNLDSYLLYDIAKLSNGGMNGFIPDATLVGTIFVNAISNILTTAAINVQFIMEYDNKAIKKPKVGEFNFTKTDKDLVIDIGTINFGQTTDILVKLKTNEKFDFTQKLTFESNNQRVSTPAKTALDSVNEPSFQTDHFRLKTVKLLKKKVLQKNVDCEQKSKQLKKFIEKWQKKASGDEIYEGILSNLQEQISIAVSQKEHYERWGKHYIRSFMRSLQLQIKNNFKDPGVEHFGGELFNEFVNIADDIFIAMPPPTPTHKKANYTQARDMRSYHNRNSGCFGPDSLVKMEDGSLKKIKLLKKGDSLHNGSKVRCVIKFFEKDGYSNIVTLKDGLQITPWHPVLDNGVWKFPANMSTTSLIRCPVVYNLVLDSNHIVNVNGIDAICLGHNYQEGILKHEYYGSQKIIDDLKKISGWDNGIIEIRQAAIERKGGKNQYSHQDQLVSGIKLSA